MTAIKLAALWLTVGVVFVMALVGTGGFIYGVWKMVAG